MYVEPGTETAMPPQSLNVRPPKLATYLLSQAKSNVDDARRPVRKHECSDLNIFFVNFRT